jgi:cysteine desulfurase/selenocysteine lyase
MNIKKDFPIFANKPQWVYLDTAATALKPAVLAQRLEKFYNHEYATVHRGAYKESMRATQEYDAARELVAITFHADPEEIIFTKGTTEGLNLLAYTLEHQLSSNDTILLSDSEHHANLVPWQLLALRKKVNLKFFPVQHDGTWDVQAIIALMTEDVKILACTHISNVYGTVFPVDAVIAAAQKKGIITVIDGAQAPFNASIDLHRLGCDFYAFSAHKCYGPTGLGILYGKKDRLAALPPWIAGGDMIEKVTLTHTTFQQPPMRFEAGTPNFADVIAFKAVLEYLRQWPLDDIINHKKNLLDRLAHELRATPRVHLVGDNPHKVSLQAMTIDGLHPLDFALYLDSHDIAIRSGHLCAMPLVERMPGQRVARVSLGIYSDESDIARFIEVLNKALKVF